MSQRKALAPGQQDHWDENESARHDLEWWWIDSKYAYAAVACRNGEIVIAAPIFKKMIGQNIANIGYRKGRLND